MLDIRGLSKNFGRTAAVQSVSIRVDKGEVLGLVGENGAGKSTILKVVAGIVQPDAGEVLVNGAAMALGDLADAARQGIRCAFQELTVLPGLTVAENLALANPVKLASPFGWSAQAARARKILLDNELDLDPARDVANLMLGDRYRLEIVRALSARPKFLLLDESTAALSAPEVDWLQRRLAAFTAAGGGIIFISHRWDEIERFCDRVVILRNGQLVHDSKTSALARDDAVRLMSGQPAGSLFPAPGSVKDKAVLVLSHVFAPGLRDISLSLREGEILGLAGLAGQGQEDLLRLIFGLARPSRGDVSLFDKPYLPRGSRQAQARGIGFVPLDRKSEGLFLTKSIRFNLAVVTKAVTATPARFLLRGREDRFVAEQIRAINIRPPEPEIPVGSLSGGNQQKVLFQRVMAERLQILLLADVTRGVDIQTKKELYSHVHAAAARGTAVLFYSTDAEELTGMCNRVAVFQRGRIVAELSGTGLTRDRIVSASLNMSGGVRAA